MCVLFCFNVQASQEYLDEVSENIVWEWKRVGRIQKEFDAVDRDRVLGYVISAIKKRQEEKFTIRTWLDSGLIDISSSIAKKDIQPVFYELWNLGYIRSLQIIAE